MCVKFYFSWIRIQEICLGIEKKQLRNIIKEELSLEKQKKYNNVL